MELWRKASFTCTLLKQCPNFILFLEIFFIIDPDKFCLMSFQRWNYQKTSVTSWHFKLHISAKNFIFVATDLPVSSVVFLMQRDGCGKCSCYPGFFQALQIFIFFPFATLGKHIFKLVMPIIVVLCLIYIN